MSTLRSFSDQGHKFCDEVIQAIKRRDAGSWPQADQRPCLRYITYSRFAVPRKPHKSSEDAKITPRLIKTNPAATRISWPGAALCPAAVIGDSAAVPKMAA